MDIEERQVGLVGFAREVELSGLQRKMAEGCFGALTIDWGDYQKHGWNNKATAISTITAHKLLIWNNHYPRILIEITPISFPALTHLIASNNRIISVECLVKAKWPQLKEIDLTSNLIVSTQSFAKMDLQQLENLNLKANPIASCDQLFKANFRRVGKIDLADANTLMAKFHMTNDPATWKVKLQAVLADDGHYYNRYERPARRARHYYEDIRPEGPTSLEYCRIREMLTRRQP